MRKASFTDLGIPLGALSLVCLGLLLASLSAHARSEAPTNAGEEIYLRGVLGSGEALEAIRDSGLRIEGKDAACVNCHRRSGFGSKEGLISIPPVAGRFLFHPRASKTEDLDLPYLENLRIGRDPYTDATLARAIREGFNSEGKPLNSLMPHYALSDADMAGLIDYLKSLKPRRSPGATSTVLHFATIITPDADPVKRQGMVAVLEQYFADKNTFPLGATPPMRTTRKEMFMVNRLWKLHVWQLTGPASTWESQLDRHYAEEPVFAVVSGLGGKTWRPIHAFCERNAVPCLFPNVDAPPEGADHDFYSLYFSRGVELEAALIANTIFDPEHGKEMKFIQQVYREGDVGAAGAQALAAALKLHGIKVRSYALPAGKLGKGVAKTLRLASRADALVLWLRPSDLAALGEARAAPDTVFVSGLMGGLERAPLPPGWRGRITLTYPFALPEQRRINVDYAFGWFSLRRIPVVAEQVQADTFLACVLLSETLKHIGETFVPEYLVERYEDMLDRQIITGYYPRLSLAPGQRFASKGGYLVRLEEPAGTRLVADGKWIVP